MSEVTGPIRSLPGALHELPEGATCDQHPDRPAVARVQGETDSMGSELNDLCQECYDEDRAYARSEEACTGRCDWCKQDATDLRDTRDYDEGMSGPVYRVCGACRKRVNDEAERELAAHDSTYYDDPEDDYDGDDNYDPGEDCGRWDQNAPGGMNKQCRLAGTEFCDFDCPYSR